MPLSDYERPVDIVMNRPRYEYKAPCEELAEMASQFNVNISGDCDEWFDEEPKPHDFGMHVVGAEYFLFPELDM